MVIRVDTPVARAWQLGAGLGSASSLTASNPHISAAMCHHSIDLGELNEAERAALVNEHSEEQLWDEHSREELGELGLAA